MFRNQSVSSPAKTTAQRRLERLGTVLLVLARTVGFVALVMGIVKARRKGST